MTRLQKNWFVLIIFSSYVSIPFLVHLLLAFVNRFQDIFLIALWHIFTRFSIFFAEIIWVGKFKKTFFSVPPFYKFILTTGLARLVLFAFFYSMSDDITRLNYLAQTVYIRKTNSDLLFGWNPSRRFHFETTNSKLEKGWLLFVFLLNVRCWFEKEMLQLENQLLKCFDERLKSGCQNLFDFCDLLFSRRHS